MKGARRKKLRRAYVFACASTGSDRLGRELGIAVVHVDVSFSPSAAISRLNVRRHGSGVLWPDGLFPIRFEDGWDDWSTFGLERASGKPMLPLGLRFVQGFIEVPLPDGVSLPELRKQLAGAMRHLRVDELVRSPRWVNARSRCGEELVCHSRYTSAGDEDTTDVSLVRDLYVADPTECAERLLWIVTAAILATTRGQESARWRS